MFKKEIFVARLIPITSILMAYTEVVAKKKKNHAKCPFHTDTGHSITIDELTGTYICSVCSDRGDSIEFVMKFKKISFYEAIHLITPAKIIE